MREVVQRCEIVTLEPLTDGRLAGYLKHKFERAGADIAQIMDAAAVDAVAARLTIRSRSTQGSRETSLLYPLAVNNLVIAAMNKAAELGMPVDADMVEGV